MDLYKQKTVELTGILTTYEDQNYILSYLRWDYPYKSLLLFYGVGMGKTYTAACLAKFYIKEGYSVLYISHSINSVSNFKFEIEKVTADSRMDESINNIDTMSFRKYANIKEHKEYGLIILDEAHNLREKRKIYEKIRSLFADMKYTKFLIMTGTPMVDKENELDTLISLSNDKKPMILFPDYVKPEIKINYIGTKVGDLTLFTSQLKGLQLQKYSKVVDTKNDIFTKTRQALLSHDFKYITSIPLDEQSCKIAKFVANIKQGRLTLVFCFYVKRGVDFLCQVLDSIGYKKYSDFKLSNKSYAIIDGRSTVQETEKIIRVFNGISNENGEKIHILIGSSVLSESLTLYRVSELHILTPCWNYGQIKQSIGRAIRIGSHNGMVDPHINIYQHAAFGSENSLMSKDIDMWKISYNKQKRIDNRIEREKVSSINKLAKTSNFSYPKPNNITVFKIGDKIWDLREVFDTNIYKISWCKTNKNKAKCYDLINKISFHNELPNSIVINLPLVTGYTIWRSCIDNRLRLTNIEKNKRGKILDNVSQKEIVEISKDLNTDNNIESIISKLKLDNRYFDKQIILKE